MKKQYRELVNSHLAAESIADKGTPAVLTEGDIAYMPEPVQNYLRYMGAVGKARVENTKISIKGEMKLGKDRPWSRVTVDQTNFYKDYARLFFIKTRMFGIPVSGIDSYVGGKGRMHIKLASWLTVADQTGPEMDQAELVTLLNDISLLSPGALVDNRIKWTPVDEHSASCTMEDGGVKVAATLYFNDDGALVDFVTDDRYFTKPDGEYVRTRWSTPVRDYRTVGGVTFPTYGEAVWHLPEGDFLYAKFHMDRIEHNVSE